MNIFFRELERQTADFLAVSKAVQDLKPAPKRSGESAVTLGTTVGTGSFVHMKIDLRPQVVRFEIVKAR